MTVTPADKDALMALVPLDGRATGNGVLMRQLGWQEARYWATRDALIEDGLLERQRGRGGAVRRVATPSEQDASEPIEVRAQEIAESIAESYERESALYEPMRSVIASDWAKDHLAIPIAVEITAAQGRKQTGGRWSRPDIVVAEVKTYLYVPGKNLSITTFEVKVADTIDVPAVYEALAHLRAATHAYVLCHVPDAVAARLEPTIAEVCRVARSHGIGVIVAGNPADYSTWDEREEAVRCEPDPERLDQFISTQLSKHAAQAIARALR